MTNWTCFQEMVEKTYTVQPCQRRRAPNEKAAADRKEQKLPLPSSTGSAVPGWRASVDARSVLCHRSFVRAFEKKTAIFSDWLFFAEMGSVEDHAGSGKSKRKDCRLQTIQSSIFRDQNSRQSFVIKIMFLPGHRYVDSQLA